VSGRSFPASGERVDELRTGFAALFSASGAPRISIRADREISADRGTWSPRETSDQEHGAVVDST